MRRFRTGEAVTNNTSRFSLASLLLISGAVPIWIFLIWAVGNSPGFGVVGYAVAAGTLVAATAAISRLFRNIKNGLALSALLAGLILTGAIVFAAVMAARYG
jgi:hypothetical protein